MLPPVQPKLLKTCSSAILAPGLMSGLVRVIVCAAAVSPPRKAAKSANTVALSISPPFQVDATGGPPSATRGENAMNVMCPALNLRDCANTPAIPPNQTRHAPPVFVPVGGVR